MRTLAAAPLAAQLAATTGNAVPLPVVVVIVTLVLVGLALQSYFKRRRR